MNVSARRGVRSPGAARPRTARAPPATPGRRPRGAARSRRPRRAASNSARCAVSVSTNAQSVCAMSRASSAPASRRVDPDDGRARERGAAQREPELGNVVEQHADVERRVGRRVRAEERGALRGRGSTTSRPRPRRVLEAQADARVAGAGAYELADRRHRAHPARRSSGAHRSRPAPPRGDRDRRQDRERRARAPARSRRADRSRAGTPRPGRRRARARARRRTTRPSRCRRASSTPRPAPSTSASPRSVNASTSIRPHVPSYPCCCAAELAQRARQRRERLGHGLRVELDPVDVADDDPTARLRGRDHRVEHRLALREVLEHGPRVHEVELVVADRHRASRRPRAPRSTPALGGWKRVSTSSDTTRPVGPTCSAIHAATVPAPEPMSQQCQPGAMPTSASARRVRPSATRDEHVQAVLLARAPGRGRR